MDLEKIRNEVGAEIKKLQRVFEALGGITVRGIQAKPRRKLSKAARAKTAEAQRAPGLRCGRKRLSANTRKGLTGPRSPRTR